MAKKLLFVINNLHCGGAENSLISLLQQLDYSDYQVDLLLFQKEGFFLRNVPQPVRILGPIDEFAYFDGSFTKAILKAFFRLRFDIILAKFKFLSLKKIVNPAEREQRFWYYLKICLPKLKGDYDVAIGFLEKTPNYYVMDKVSAKRKMGFIRTDYEALGMIPSLDEPYFEKMDCILANSTHAESSLKKLFPHFGNKIKVVENFFSPETLHAMADEKITIAKGDITLVSVGRLHPAKGYDMAIEACKIIKEKGIDIKWYVIGEGGERPELERLIKAHQVQNQFILVGLKANPHPYIKAADLYVQTSRFEGKSRAIEEAKIHQKPILITNYPSANDQIQHLQNGYIVDMNAEAIAEGILYLHHQNEVKIKLISNLQNTLIDNQQQLQVFYALVD